MGIREQKRALRRTANEAIAAMTAVERRRGDASICGIVRSLPAYGGAEQLLAYWPLADEVDVRALLFAAVETGKAVFLPITRDGAITFRRWHPQTEMSAGALGVQEPTAGQGPGDMPADRRSIVLVPGRAFSRAGHRLGRGGGFYDRAWSGLERYAPRVGVGYACQVFADVPHDEHDSVVDLLVCERGVVSDTAA